MQNEFEIANVTDSFPRLTPDKKAKVTDLSEYEHFLEHRFIGSLTATLILGFGHLPQTRLVTSRHYKTSAGDKTW